MNTCSKRVIIHPNVDLTIAVSAAIAFDKEYVVEGKGSTGIYHSRNYVGHVDKTGPDGKIISEEVSVDVHQSSTSIIVKLSQPLDDESLSPQKENQDLSEMTPEPLAQEKSVQ